MYKKLVSTKYVEIYCSGMNEASLGRENNTKGNIKKQSHAATCTITCKMTLLNFIIIATN